MFSETSTCFLQFIIIFFSFQKHWVLIFVDNMNWFNYYIYFSFLLGLFAFFFLNFCCFQFQLSLPAAMDFHFHARFVSVDLLGFSPSCSPLFLGFFCCMLVVSFYFLCFVVYYVCFLDFSLLCFSIWGRFHLFCSLVWYDVLFGCGEWR